MNILSAAGMFLIFMLIIFLLSKENLLYSTTNIIICSTLALTAIMLRLYFFEHRTYDYTDFLRPWMEFFSENGGFKALKYSIGNYNVPYLYFLALFSYFETEGLYLIKLLSVFFDVILAYGMMKLVELYRPGEIRMLAAFFGILFLPTVVLNGSVWAQCDAIYAAFAVLGLWLALDDRPILSMICFAASFSVKLQAVFVLPIIAVLWYKGKFKLWHSLIFPASYVVIVLPAVLLGRPFWDTVTLYFNQTGSIGSGLNYNSSSVYAFFPNESNIDFWSKVGIILAFTFMIVILLWLLKNRDRITDEVILATALLFCIGIPFLLPHMHDRYFFLADVFSIGFAVIFPKLFVLPVLTQFASLLGYHAYLKMRYLLPMRYGAEALMIAIVILIAFIICNLATTKSRRKRSI